MAVLYLVTDFLCAECGRTLITASEPNSYGGLAVVHHDIVPDCIMSGKSFSALRPVVNAEVIE
jgi:hypothetical protein